MVGTLTGGDFDEDDGSIDEDSDDGQAFLSDDEEQQGGYAQQGAYYGGQVGGKLQLDVVLRVCDGAGVCSDKTRACP
jgi:hypothetical protein